MTIFHSAIEIINMLGVPLIRGFSIRHRRGVNMEHLARNFHAVREREREKRREREREREKERERDARE